MFFEDDNPECLLSKNVSIPISLDDLGRFKFCIAVFDVSLSDKKGRSVVYQGELAFT